MVCRLWLYVRYAYLVHKTEQLYSWYDWCTVVLRYICIALWLNKLYDCTWYDYGAKTVLPYELVPATHKIPPSASPRDRINKGNVSAKLILEYEL